MKSSFAHLEKGRIKQGEFKSKEGDHFGAFYFILSDQTNVHVIVDDGEQTGWEHVSATMWKNRKGKSRPIIPTYDQMQFIKQIFWEDDEAVIQIHPPKDQYVNNHQTCYHLWRNKNQKLELPPKILV